ncbi:MAG: hypothetical protein PF569_09185 [Candidatus Woesearchaeota archaeon]|jgi:hypothetical protein|nr:hypothetical protein [Candidatus Woesearchaeota archaeon]
MLDINIKRFFLIVGVILGFLEGVFISKAFLEINITSSGIVKSCGKYYRVIPIDKQVDINYIEVVQDEEDSE